MASDEDNNYNSDEEINTKQHKQFLQDVFQMDKKQYVKKPTRTEPTAHVSEFNLVKTTTGRTSTVNIEDLTKALDNKKKLGDVSKKIKSTQKKAKTLRAPLEKPQRERIKRGVGFKEVKEDLGKWDAIVTKNRVTTQLHFPLDGGKLDIVKGKRPVFQLSLKSKLDEELEKLDPPKVPEPEIETFPMTLKEILERRREMARLRAQQSYQEAKYHRQNKIKSKKFHRIQRKAKIKDQIKEFEKLQKTDPEEALRKLEEIEKARAEERMSLRHKSTGQWARNKQIRAKYDKDTRQELSQQLALSRELTQKQNVDSDSDSEKSDIEIKSTDQSNPWTSGVKTEKEITDFLSGYRKYWEEKNKNDKNEKHENETTENKTENIETKKRKIEELKLEIQNLHDKILTRSGKVVNKISNDDNLTKKIQNGLQLQKTNKKPTKKAKKVKCTSDWNVEVFNKDDVTEIFDDLEDMTRKKIITKVGELKKNIKQKPVKVMVQKKIKPQKMVKKKSKTSNFMEFTKEIIRPDIDEELLYLDEPEPKKDLRALANSKPVETNIDPNNFLKPKQIKLNTQIPDNIIGSDSESDDEQKALIAEAFAGDDVVSEFRKEKKDLINSEKPEDVNLTLPGWGEWGGKNIKPSKRKRKRFIVKFPKKVPRRDDNRGQLIINEKSNENLKKHLVSEVPFPFKTVKDFEASIRAPIGDTFVPQSAFRRLIKPAIVTKKGEVIKPMDEQVLVNHKFTKTGNVVKR